MTAWQIAVGLVLALTVVVSLLRLARQPGIAPRWRRISLWILQPACALALYLMLYPPLQRAPGNTLVVLTARAAPGAVQPGQPRIALPEASAPAGVDTVPDLATALRQHPGIARLRIVGDGLPARDREAVGGLALDFEPSPALPGIVQLATPAPVAPGNAFDVQGRVQGWPGARVELLDPAGRRMDAAQVDADGRFSLAGQAGIAGDVAYAVRVLDAAGSERERQALPVSVVAPPALDVWILAGAPQPEWKYLRRWAADAGLSLHTQIAVGGGLQLGDAPLPLDAATLDRFDLLWLDERALATLSRAQRDAITAAARRGLGVLVRLGGPLDAGGRQALAQLGLPMRGGQSSVPLALAGSDVAAAPNRRDFAPTVPLQVLAGDAKSVAYAWWRPLGQGRVGVTALTDSYRLALAGERDAHARLWSTVLSTLARANPATGPAARLPALAWSGERLAICSAARQLQVRDPGGRVHGLQRDPATGTPACAGYWPLQAGWHRAIADGREQAFYVRDPLQARAWFQHETTAATSRLVSSTAAGSTPPGPGRPGSRWPFWWAFVLLAAASAWLERPRRV